MRRGGRIYLALAFFLAQVASQSVLAQAGPINFTFASAQEGAAILGAQDDYILATAALERSARLHTTESVDTQRLADRMRGETLEWSETEQERLRTLFPYLNRFLSGAKNLPPIITLIKASPTLEDGMPHTRANAIVLPANILRQSPAVLARLMAHEVFHVISRANPVLRERLYESIGFKRCEQVDVPEQVARLRISNPDAVESRHTISVRFQGKAVEALPFIRFGSANVDPRSGFAANIEVAWLLVERDGPRCKAAIGRTEEFGIAPERFEGLKEQIGENTGYLFHPEEILADNFAILFLGHASGKPPPVPSPHIVERVRKIFFD